AVVHLAIEALVFEEEDGVLALERRPEQTGGIACTRRHDDEEPGDVREDVLAGLRVPDGAALEIAADRDAQHHRDGPHTVRPPARRRGLGLDLLHSRPDVVEELDLGGRMEAADGLTDRASDDVLFREWLV